MKLDGNFEKQFLHKNFSAMKAILFSIKAVFPIMKNVGAANIVDFLHTYPPRKKKCFEATATVLVTEAEKSGNKKIEKNHTQAILCGM